MSKHTNCKPKDKPTPTGILALQAILNHTAYSKEGFLTYFKHLNPQTKIQLFGEINKETIRTEKELSEQILKKLKAEAHIDWKYSYIGSRSDKYYDISENKPREWNIGLCARRCWTLHEDGYNFKFEQIDAMYYVVNYSDAKRDEPKIIWKRYNWHRGGGRRNIYTVKINYKTCLEVLRISMKDSNDKFQEVKMRSEQEVRYLTSDGRNGKEEYLFGFDKERYEGDVSDEIE